MLRMLPALLVLVGTSAALGQKPPAVVEFDKASPAGGNGKVTATGTYTADEGWEPVTVKLWIIPRGGGVAPEVKTTDVAAGKWGPVTLKDVPAGEYSATVWIVFRHEKKGEVTIGSRLVVVRVP